MPSGAHQNNRQLSSKDHRQMTHLMYYTLDENGNPIEEPNPMKWAKWFKGNLTAKHVARDEFDNVYVSTVFLGVDHSFSEEGPPILYETMIFGGEHDEYQERYPNKISALAGHDQAVALVRDSLKP